MCSKKVWKNIFYHRKTEVKFEKCPKLGHFIGIMDWRWKKSTKPLVTIPEHKYAAEELLIGGNTWTRACRGRALDWRQYLCTSMPGRPLDWRQYLSKRMPRKSTWLEAIPEYEHAAEELLIGGNTWVRAFHGRALDWRQYLSTSMPRKSSWLEAIPEQKNAAEELLIEGKT